MGDFGTYRGSELQHQVIEFHRVFDHPIAEAPVVPPDDRVRLRARLVVEEALEFVEALFDADSGVHFDEEGTGRVTHVKAKEALHEARAILKGLIDQARVDVSLTSVADALADLDYVAAGSRLECGIDGDPIAREVHRSNMAKKGGGKRADGKQAKPLGWAPPDIARELALQTNSPATHGLARILREADVDTE